MPQTDSLARFFDTGVSRWTPWHQSFEQPVHKLYDTWNADPDRSTLGGYVGTTKGLQAMIQRSLDEERSLRALGGGWSWPPIAATAGTLLNTRPLNYRFNLRVDQIHGDRKLVFVQCGMSIAELNVYLAAKGLALKTSGASNGQTIAGALSTGTHGAAYRVGAVPDYVVAIHLVTEPGRSVWLERDSEPAVVDSVAGHVGAELVRNDDLFEAALVSFGSFGIIHGLVLEVDELYHLNAWRTKITLDQALWDAIEAADFDGLDLPGSDAGFPLHHFELLVNPYESGQAAGDLEVFASLMYRHEGACPDGAKRASQHGRFAQGDGTLELIGKLTDVFPGLTDDLSGLADKLKFKDSRNVCGPPGDVFRDTTTRGKSASSAMGVPLNRLREALEIGRVAILEEKAPALISVRLVRASRATLAFTHHQPVTAVFEIDGADSARVHHVYRRVQDAVRSAGIPYTYHWGKIHTLSADRVRELYGNRIQDWIDARHELLPTRELRRVFANSYTDQLGLSD